MKDRVKCKVALFSLYSDNIRVEQHCADGGLGAYLENGYLILRIGNHIVPVEEVKHVPITFEGRAEFNVSNVLAAILAAYTNNIKLSTIRKALQTFVPSSETTPGRMNIFEFSDFTVIVDYAHNPHGVKAMGRFIKSVGAEHRIGVITGVGDRRDEDISTLAEEAAKIFDEIVIRHDEDLRGRTHEDLDRLLTIGIHRVDRNKPIHYFWNECEAVEQAIRNRRPRSLIVIFIEDFHAVLQCIQNLQKEEQAKNQVWRTAV
jgi:cyanophycin synthetase